MARMTHVRTKAKKNAIAAVLSVELPETRSFSPLSMADGECAASATAFGGAGRAPGSGSTETSDARPSNPRGSDSGSTLMQAFLLSDRRRVVRVIADRMRRGSGGSNYTGVSSYAPIGLSGAISSNPDLPALEATTQRGSSLSRVRVRIL